MNNLALEQHLNQLLNVGEFHDCAPNGLQVEGKAEIQRVVTGVTACQALLDAALEKRADAILVHHGYFWKKDATTIRGMQRNRLKTLLSNDINLYGYHLPLDAHPELGNNAQLAKRLQITPQGNIAPLLPFGEFSTPLSAADVIVRIEDHLQHSVLHSGDNAPSKIRRIAWCTGGGQSFIEQAAVFGVDAFITGEVSEKTIHIAREMGIHFFAAGHHATERDGIRVLGEWLAQHHGLDVTFIDIDNPA